MTPDQKILRAVYIGSADSAIKAYMPSNYWVASTQDGRTLIVGYDSAGWTMEDYVLPRLASGLYFPVDPVEIKNIGSPSQGIEEKE